MVEGSAKAAAIAVALARALSCFIIMPSQRAATADGGGLSVRRCVGALGATPPLPRAGEGDSPAASGVRAVEIAFDDVGPERT